MTDCACPDPIPFGLFALCLDCAQVWDTRRKKRLAIGRAPGWRVDLERCVHRIIPEDQAEARAILARSINLPLQEPGVGVGLVDELIVP